MATVAELMVKINGDIEGLKRAIGGAKGQIDGMMTKAMPGSMVLAGAFTAAAAAAGVLGGKAVSLAMDMEQTEVAFGTLLGSGEAATKMMEDLNAFAATTPFQFPELAKGAKLLAAFGVETEQIIPSMRRLGDVSAGIGAPISEIAEIYGKAKVQGRLFMEDINQLTGRGIPIIGELAKQFGVTEAEIRDLVSSGQVNFGHLEQAFIDLTSEGGKFEGMMEAQSQTLGGLWSTVKDNITLSLTGIGKTIIEAFDLKDKAAGLIEGLSTITGKINEFAELVAEVGLKEALESLFSEETKVKIFLIAGAILGALVPAAYAAATAFFAMMLPLLPFVLIGAAIGALAYLIYANWDKLKAFFTTFWDSIIGIWEGITAWVEETWTAIGEFLTGLWEGIKEGASAWAESIKTTLSDAWGGMKQSTENTWNAISTFMSGVWSNIRGIGDGAVGNIIDTVVNGFQTVFNFVKSIWDAVLAFFKSIWEAIKALFRGDLDAVKKHVEDAFNGIADFIKGIGGKMIQYGKDIIQGLIDGAKQMATRLIDAVKGVVTGAIDAAKRLLGISSPSKLFGEMGMNIGLGFIKGIESMKGQVEASMQGMVNPMPIMGAGASTGGYGAGQSISHNNSKTFAPNITIISPEPLSHSEIRRKEKQLVRNLALEWGM